MLTKTPFNGEDGVKSVKIDLAYVVDLTPQPIFLKTSFFNARRFIYQLSQY